MTNQPDPTASRAANRRRGLAALGLAVVLGAAGYGAYSLLAGDSQDTDDAYVAGNLVAITAKEAGTVIAIHADNTQGVKAGAPLIDFDPSLVDAQMAAAEARLASAVRGVRSGFTRVRSAEAGVARAEVALATARADLARRQAAAGAITAEEVAHAADAVKNAEASLTLAQSQRAEADAAVGGTGLATNPEVLAAIAEMRRLAIMQSHMHLVAPVDGVVAQRNVQLGQQVAPGVPLMQVVPLRQLWVDANFRETQLADIRIGQPASLNTDAYGKRVTFHGHVAGLAAGSGSAFALLPAQNASGNWIKIVQRLPVRIALDPAELDRHPLRIGLSATVTIDTSNHQGTPVVAAPAQLVAEQAVPDVTGPVNARIARIIAANSGTDQAPADQTPARRGGAR